MGVFEGQVLESIKEKMAPEDDLAQEMTQGLEMKFNKIAPLGKEDTAEELQELQELRMKTVYQLFDKLTNKDLPLMLSSQISSALEVQRKKFEEQSNDLERRW